MNGFTFKTAIITFALLLTAFLSSPTFAANTANGPNKTTIFTPKLGCMACHQGETIQPDKASKENHDNLHRQNQAQTVPAD